MTKKVATRKELLDRWRDIENEDEEEEEEEDGSADPLTRRRLHQRKEDWFLDAFNFLVSLPNENHIWCGSRDIMWPLLESFYNYFKDYSKDSPLKRLWKRISEEMRQCIQCISQHHQAQETYTMVYELSTIGPLLDVLQTLDEERVMVHLAEINHRMAAERYDAAHDNIEVVNVMYEVLMFPVLLDDQSLFIEFGKFIEAVDNVHELSLAGQQQFPGVYALFFFNRRVRSVGYRLAGSMGTLRSAASLEPLQPLLSRFVCVLESEVVPPNSTSKAMRPRVQLDRASVWLGIKSLIGFLEPPALEEGILERYPIFLDIVLNHISGDSLEFSHAVMCFRLLCEMLGCKLWLSSTLSPSVICNTLLGQCFHTRNEKSHKDILDLFQPFLQSLEAFQDGEHEKQRRQFLYFLLHQVPVSNNFSVLTRKKACQVALQIVLRGYKLNPPCPPFECAHMWGPSLASSMKDSSLHSSLRQPAFDLIQTIIVSDSAALIRALLESSILPSSFSYKFHKYNDGGGDDSDADILASNTKERDLSCWSEFNGLSKMASLEYKEWMCIPMLWVDVLVEIDPSVLPVSFSKAVFWARSQFSMVEPELSAEMMIPVRSWLSSSSVEISGSLRWKVPTGSNDGGDGKESINSLKVCTMLLPLIRAFNRLTTHYLLQLGRGELCKQWSWEPRMSESLILSLFDPIDNFRQFGKCMLEQVSNTRGLTSGLKFLCSSESSLVPTFLGLRHASRLVQLDSVLLKFQYLHHFFFILRKLLLEGDLCLPDFKKTFSDHLNNSKVSSQGGFLTQPDFDVVPWNGDGATSKLDFNLLSNFVFSLSEATWPSIRRCLVEGKAYVDCNLCQMTCVRLLEILPLVFQRLWSSFFEDCGGGMKLANVQSFSWLHDLMDWGKSSLKVVVTYWKKTVISLLNLLKGSCSTTSTSIIMVVENIISCENGSMDELTEQVSLLTVSLSKEASNKICGTKSASKALIPLADGDRKYSISNVNSVPEKDADLKIFLPKHIPNQKNDMIVLSDDESELHIQPILSEMSSANFTFDEKTVSPGDGESIPGAESAKNKGTLANASKFGLEFVPSSDSKDDHSLGAIDNSKSKLVPTCLLNLNDKDDKMSDTDYKCQGNGYSTLPSKSNIKFSSDEVLDSKSVRQSETKVSIAADALLKQIVGENENDSLDSMLNSVRCPLPNIIKPKVSLPKRQVIQLKTPVEHRADYWHKFDAGVKRFQPPRLEEWYGPILEIDYFAMVRLTSANKGGSRTGRNLKEVPTCFQSLEHYLQIFQPLVLEEFKAQLQKNFLELSSLEEMYFGSLSVLSVERIDDFHIVHFSYDDNDMSASKCFLENDLVLLTKEPPQKSSNDVHMIGKVDRRERTLYRFCYLLMNCVSQVDKRERDNKRRITILIVRLYLLNGSSRLHQARRNLNERCKWHASRIMSITPLLREFQALSSIKTIPIFPLILNPAHSLIVSDESRQINIHKLPHSLQQKLTASFNDGQLKAINVAIGPPTLKNNFELSLIQGPPGTGKTRTILAIVSCLLASPSQKTSNLKSSLKGGLKQNNASCDVPIKQLSETCAIARAWQDAALAKQLNEGEEKSLKSPERSTRRRVLLCAQSNAAVDELVSRISSLGLYGSSGEMYKPYLVRVGNAKTVHSSSLPFFIDTLVDHQLAEEKRKSADTKNVLSKDSSMVLRSNLDKLVNRIRFYEAKRADLRDVSSDIKDPVIDDTEMGDKEKKVSDSEIESKLRKLYDEKKQIYKDLSFIQAVEKKSNVEAQTMKYKLRKSILREAEVVVATLSGCGGDLYGVCAESMMSSRFCSPSEHTLFDAIVIDEAAQALEPATLIPLQLLKSNRSKCIMVGDPKQLPGTVFSTVASKFRYECSMFERLQKAGHPVTMLTKQYRMHPEICWFPSLHFYDRKLENGDQMFSKSAPFHELKGLGPYVFYDISDGEELRGKNSAALSLYNDHEAEAAIELVRFLKKRFGTSIPFFKERLLIRLSDCLNYAIVRYPAEFVNRSIGVVTPYNCQLSVLRSRFSQAFGASVTDDIEFNTVDGFQGREVDILILSTVRSADLNCSSSVKSGSIGFVADVRRMNVALTRAKLSLWILGNARTLQKNPDWAALVKDAEKRNLILSIQMPYKLMHEKIAENLLLGSCNRNLRHMKCVETVKEGSRTSGMTMKGTSDGRKRQVQFLESSTKSGWEVMKDCRTAEKGFCGDKIGGRNERDFPSKISRSSLVEKNVIPTVVGKESMDDKTEEWEVKKELQAENIVTHKRISKHRKSRSNLDHYDKVIGEDDQNLESKLLKTSKEISEQKKDSRHLDVPSPSLESSFRGNEANDGGEDPHQVTKSENSIAKRKHQREDVDAILCSALIPRKKFETSSKTVPAKLPGIKASKRRKS